MTPLYRLFHLIITTSQQGGSYYYTHFTEEEVGFQSDYYLLKVRNMVDMGFKPK